MRGLAVVGALAAAGALAVAVPATAGERTNVGVTAREFTLTLSKAKVDPGKARIQYVNSGEDPHDLKVRRRGTRRVRAVAELAPSGIGELKLRVKRDSRYLMWCSTLDGAHRAQGMEAELRVRKRR